MLLPNFKKIEPVQWIHTYINIYKNLNGPSKCVLGVPVLFCKQFNYSMSKYDIEVYIKEVKYGLCQE